MASASRARPVPSCAARRGAGARAGPPDGAVLGDAARFIFGWLLGRQGLKDRGRLRPVGWMNIRLERIGSADKRFGRIPGDPGGTLSQPGQNEVALVIDVTGVMCNGLFACLGHCMPYAPFHKTEPTPSSTNRPVHLLKQRRAASQRKISDSLDGSPDIWKKEYLGQAPSRWPGCSRLGRGGRVRTSSEKNSARY